MFVSRYRQKVSTFLEICDTIYSKSTYSLEDYENAISSYKGRDMKFLCDLLTYDPYTHDEYYKLLNIVNYSHLLLVIARKWEIEFHSDPRFLIIAASGTIPPIAEIAPELLSIMLRRIDKDGKFLDRDEVMEMFSTDMVNGIFYNGSKVYPKKTRKQMWEISADYWENGLFKDIWREWFVKSGKFKRDYDPDNIWNNEGENEIEIEV